ncbi:hypothetical protein A5881_002687 [Enterococcus termitis]|nr:phage integrase [Enterococcus termitis]
MFKKYLGVDPLTGKQKETTRRGFKTIKEAKIALSRLEVEIQENGIQSKPKKRKYKKEDEEETADIFAAFMEQGKSLGQNLGQKKSPLK